MDHVSGLSRHERQHKYPQPPSLEELGLVRPGSEQGKRRSGDDLPKMKKFRFQLLAQWIASNFPPCSVADVGGGKGLLAYLLNQASFDATVVDPTEQGLPAKYKDIVTGQRVKLAADLRVPRLSSPFDAEIGRRFDLLVALHAHGANLEILETVAQANNSCVILPCCVIDEPSVPPPGQNWFMWLVEHARRLGLEPEFFYLNFSGQNVGLYVRGERPSRRLTSASGPSPRSLPR